MALGVVRRAARLARTVAGSSRRSRVHRQLLRRELRQRAAAEAGRLRSEGGLEQERLADALAVATRPWALSRLPAADRAQVRAIEAQRRVMERSTLHLLRTDGTSQRLGTVTTRTSKQPPEALLLFVLVRQYRPERCVEMGTSVGISGAYQAAALALNGTGRLVSLDGQPDSADQARRLWARLGLRTAQVRVGAFDDTFEPVLAEGPVDHAFVDGYHHEQATIAYYRRLAAQAPAGAVLVFDDIAWSDGMRRAWQVVSTDDAVEAFADLGRLGVVVLGPRGPGTP